MEFKAWAVKVAAAPVQHFFVNIDAYIPAGESFLFEVVITEMVGEAAATTTNIENVGVQAAKPGKKCMKPKICRLVQIIDMIRKHTISHADPDAQMIGRKVGEFFKNMARYKIDDIE